MRDGYTTTGRNRVSRQYQVSRITRIIMTMSRERWWLSYIGKTSSYSDTNLVKIPRRTMAIVVGGAAFITELSRQRQVAIDFIEAVRD